jgi:hypothetical protein
MIESANATMEVPTIYELARQIERRVCNRLSGRVQDFHVEVRDAGLVLQGRTRTYHAKQLVQQAVMETAKLPILANEVEVF